MTDQTIQIIAKILAFIVKCVIFYIVYQIILHFYDPKETFFGQHILIYIFLYLPCIIGIERLIKSIFEPLISK